MPKTQEPRKPQLEWEKQATDSSIKINQMLVLPDNDFKAVIIKCLDNQLLIFLKQMEKRISAKK